MKFNLETLIKGTLVVALAASMSAAPSFAQTSSTTTITTTTRSSSPMMIRQIRYPATVTSINGDSVIVDVNGSPVTLQRTWATYQIDGRVVDAGSLRTGQRIMVNYPDFNGNVTTYDGHMLLVTDSNGNSYMIPRSALNDPLYGDMVYVKMSNGNYAMVSLRTALDLQNNNSATIVSIVPEGATLAPYATADDNVMSGRNRGINFSEGVRTQKDASKLIQDQSIEGDNTF